MCRKNSIPIFICFCVIALQIYREIKKKDNNSAKEQFFKNLRKPFLDMHIRNVMPKFESSRLNSLAVIAKTYPHIHTYPHTVELR